MCVSPSPVCMSPKATLSRQQVLGSHLRGGLGGVRAADGVRSKALNGADFTPAGGAPWGWDEERRFLEEVG